MPLLRRPHDNRRALRARWPAARPAVIPSRGQGRRTMTPAATRAHCTLAGRLHSRRHTAFASVPPAGAVTPPIGRNSHHYHRPPRQNLPRHISLVIANGSPVAPKNPLPAKTVAPSNPHRRQPPNRSPRVPSWGAFGRRPSERPTSYDGPVSETLHHTSRSRHPTGTAQLGG